MGYTEAMEILQLVSSDGDIDLIRKRIASAGADELNAVSKKRGNTPLHLAAIKDRAEIIALLLHAGATIDLKNSAGDTPLLVATSRRHKDCAQLLLLAQTKKLGGDTDMLDEALHNAVKDYRSSGMVSPLIWIGADVNARNSDGESPLLVAAREAARAARETAWGGNTGLVQLLLNHGADVNALDKNHESPLLVAARGVARETARWGNTYLVQLLLNHGADVNALDKNHESPLLVAAREAAREAAWGGNICLVQLLLNHGADVNALDKNHESPLLMATRGLARRGNTDLVQLLLSHGADVNALDKNHESPLLVAARGGNTDLVQLLLSHGADANALDKNHESPLLLALEKNNLDCIRILLPLTSEANINGHDSRGRTPLSIAAGRGDDKTVKLLLNAGADPNKPPSPETQTLEDPLKAAISNYYVKTATTLLQNGALLNGPAYDALAGFYIDFGANTTNTTYYDKRRLLPDRLELLEIMLQLGMDPSQTISQQGSACGDTLLHVMCRHDASIEEILKLLEYDRNALNKKNADGDTPLASHIGGEKLRVGVVRTLLDYGADATVTNDEELSLLSLLDKRPVVEVTDSVREVLIDNGADDLVQSQPPQPERSLSGGAPGAYRCFPM